MSYTLGEAAKATGMSKAAISRAIKNHTISAEKQDNGSYKIDPAELHRVYPALSTQQAEQQVKPRSTSVSDATELNAENRELRAKLEAATQRLSDKDAVIDDLREDREPLADTGGKTAADRSAGAGDHHAAAGRSASPDQAGMVAHRRASCGEVNHSTRIRAAR